jgi:hypothetical protein
MSGRLVQDSDITVRGSVTVAGGATLDLNGRDLTIGDSIGEGLTVGFGGRLLGRATISTAGAVVNEGVVSPGDSPGMLTLVTNEYRQTASGTLSIELEGTVMDSGYDDLRVNGEARLGGTLEVTFVDPFVPAPGDTFEVLRSEQLIGQFDVVVGPPGHDLQVLYGPEAVRLTFSPTVERDDSSWGKVKDIYRK